MHYSVMSKPCSEIDCTEPTPQEGNQAAPSSLLLQNYHFRQLHGNQKVLFVTKHSFIVETSKVDNDCDVLIGCQVLSSRDVAVRPSKRKMHLHEQHTELLCVYIYI